MSALFGSFHICVCSQYENGSLIGEMFGVSSVRVATGQGKVREIQGQGKVREFCNWSGKFGILRKVREFWNWSGKFDFLMSYAQ